MRINNTLQNLREKRIVGLSGERKNKISQK